MIVWISKPLALAIHERLLAEHGGSAGVRDAAALDSALARPQRWASQGDPTPDIAALAASLAFALAQHRPFVDGNKRTAAVCCETFIRLNHGVLLADEVSLYTMYVELAEDSLDEDEFAAWLRRHIAHAPGHRVNEARARYAR